MADRDVDGADVGPRAHDGPNDLIAVGDGISVAPIGAGRFVLAQIVGLADADGGNAAGHAQVAGQTKAARVDAAVAVAQDEVGPVVQRRQRLQNGRQLAKGQQAKHLGKRGWPAGDIRSDQSQVWEGEKDDGGACRLAAVLKADVHPGYVAHLAHLVALDHLVAQRRLQGDGFVGGGGPGEKQHQPQSTGW